jgi:hypothetical protein
MERPGGSESYTDASLRVRAAWARSALVDILYWAFDMPVMDLPDDELADFFVGLRERIAFIEPAWASQMDTLRHERVARVRRELATAYASIRTIAQAVAIGQPTAIMPRPVRLALSERAFDRDGRPRFTRYGRLADALVETTMMLVAEVPRSLIRTCAWADCPRVYVAAKNQKFCPHHQEEAARQAQRRAERAFHARQRAKSKRRTG